MERSIKRSEEDITKLLIKWLIDNQWRIVCYDFPHSGTGRQLHPNNTTSKTTGVIIPDIVAIKDGVVVYFENKDRFVFSDLEKVYKLKNTNDYSEDWDKLLSRYSYQHFYYGIGIPYTPHNLQKTIEHIEYVDFAALLKNDGSIYFIGEMANHIENH